MVDQISCERRVFRLATLLTGDTEAAESVLRRVLGDRPVLAKLEGSRLDRLTVLRAREEGQGVLDDVIAEPVARALAALEAQQREAWVLHRVYRMGERDAARAMDCSVTASARHLYLAESHLQQASETDLEAVAGKLLHYSLELDVPTTYIARRQIRRRIRSTMRWVALAAGVFGALAGILWILESIQ